MFPSTSSVNRIDIIAECLTPVSVRDAFAAPPRAANQRALLVIDIAVEEWAG
jgi:hypothetical protein